MNPYKQKMPLKQKHNNAQKQCAKGLLKVADEGKKNKQGHSHEPKKGLYLELQG